MPAQHLHIELKAIKSLKKLPLRIQKRITVSLSEIKANPTIGIKLHGELQNYYKCRLGDYRIIYSFNATASTVKIIYIEHRQGVYK